MANVDLLGGVAHLLCGVGDDEGHRVADMTNPVARQCASRRHDHRRNRRHPGDARQCPDTAGIEIGGGENAMLPRASRWAATASMPSIDACPWGERSTIPCRWPGTVGDIAPVPGQKPLVLEAAQRPPDMISGHARYCCYRALMRRSPLSSQVR